MDRLIALVALRLKLEIRGLARAKESFVALLIMIPGLLLSAGFLSVLAFFGLRHLGAARPELVLPAVSAAATVIGPLWALSPLIAGIALTESHDVGRLLHFPIPARTLVLSSLLSNLVQPAVLGATMTSIAVGLGLAERLVYLPLTVAGVFLTLGFLLVAAQGVGLLFQGLARNRRWHDVALFFGLAFAFATSLLPIVLLSGGFRLLATLARALTVYDVFAFSPFAWGVRAAAHAGHGDILPFLAYGAAQLVAIGLAILLTVVLLERIHRGEVVLTRTSAAAGPARIVLPGSLGALVEKDLRSGWRDPAIRAAFFMGLVGPAVLLFVLTQTPLSRPSSSLLVLAMLVGLSPFGANAFGLERRGLALLMSFPIPRWKVLLGKNVSALVLRLPGFVVLGAVGLFLAPLYLLPAAATIAFVTLLLSAAADNYLSILFPVPAPPPAGNPYSGVSGTRGWGAALMGMLLLGAVAAMAAPFVFLTWLPVLLESPPLWLITLPLAILGGLAVYAMLVLGAERVLRAREPELLERVLEGP